MSDTTTFQYNGMTYTLQVKSTKKQDELKGTYVVRFPRNSTPPAGLSCDKDYILLTLTHSPNAVNHMEAYPSLRQYWDFFPFQGNHFREILLLDDNAQTLQKELVKKGGAALKDYTTTTTFKLLEPVYEEVNIGRLTAPADLRLEYLRQCCVGLRELYSNNCKHISNLGALYEAPFDAHRDMKFANALVDWHSSDTFTVRLIDFATVHINGINAGTNKGLISPSNTAPEDICSTYPVGPPTDVWALGGMMAQLYGNKNPLAVLYEDYTLSDIYYDPDKEDDWIEKMLVNKFHWNADTPDGIKELFRSATRIPPGKRISIKDFQAKLETLMVTLPGPYFLAVVDPSLLPAYTAEIAQAINGLCSCGGRILCPHASGPVSSLTVFPGENLAAELARIQTGAPVPPCYITYCIRRLFNYSNQNEGHNHHLFLFLADAPMDNDLQQVLYDFHDYDSCLYTVLCMPAGDPADSFGHDTFKLLNSGFEPSPRQAATPQEALVSEIDRRANALDNAFGKIAQEDGWSINISGGELFYVGRKG